MELNEKQFIAGFNSGYILAEFEPKILTSLLHGIQPINSYLSGMSSGQKEYEMEFSYKHINELRLIRQNNKSRLSKEIE